MTMTRESRSSSGNETWVPWQTGSRVTICTLMSRDLCYHGYKTASRRISGFLGNGCTDYRYSTNDHIGSRYIGTPLISKCTYLEYVNTSNKLVGITLKDLESLIMKCIYVNTMCHYQIWSFLRVSNLTKTNSYLYMHK